MRLDLNDLSSDPLKLERFARERYFMKRPDEDLFRIIPTKDVSAS